MNRNCDIFVDDTFLLILLRGMLTQYFAQPITNSGYQFARVRVY